MEAGKVGGQLFLQITCPLPLLQIIYYARSSNAAFSLFICEYFRLFFFFCFSYFLSFLEVFRSFFLSFCLSPPFLPFILSVSVLSSFHSVRLSFCRPRGLTFTWWGCCGLCLTRTNRACPLLFLLFLCLFLSLSLFQLHFIPQILPTTHRFLTLLVRSYLCFIGPFNCMSFYESLLQPCYNA